METVCRSSVLSPTVRRSPNREPPVAAQPRRAVIGLPKRSVPGPQRRPDITVLGAVAVAAALRFLALGDHPVAPAEAAFWEIASRTSAGVPPWPPMASLPTAMFTAFAGLNELTVRWPSAASGVLMVAMIAPLGRRLGGQPLARWAAWLAATSPYLVFYDRTATALALTSLLGLAATWWYLFLTTGRPRAVAGFCASMLLLAWTSGAVVPIAVAQAAFLWVRRAGRTAWHFWLVGIAVAVVGVAPALLGWAGHVGLHLDQSRDFAAEGTALLYKVIAPVAAFAVGETLSIAQPVGLLGLMLMTVLALRGVARLPRPGRQFVIIFWLFPVLWTATMTALVTPPSAASGVSATVGYAFPAFGLGVAAGILSLTPALRRLAYAGLVAVAAFGLGGYFHARDVAQPSYLLPLDRILAFIDARAESGDQILADRASMVPHHASRHAVRLPIIETADRAAVASLLNAEPPPRLWHVAAADEPSESRAALERWLATHYRSVESRRYAESDPAMSAIRERLLGESSNAGLVLTLYERR